MMQTPLDKLRAALPHLLKKEGGHYRTSCPGPGHNHGNRNNPALTIRETAPGGKVIIKCHADCDWLDVLRAVGLSGSDTYPIDEQEAKPDWNPFKDGVLFDTYRYFDRGDEKYIVERREPKSGHTLHGTGVKDFKQKHYDPANPKAWRDGYVNGRNNRPLILWKLDEVREAAAEGKEVLVVEGEEDVKTANSLGIVATCSPGGASKGTASKWKPELYCPPLKGAHVIVIPDNDVAGRMHARVAATSLVGIAASVKLLPPLGDAAKYDLTDFVRDGGTLEDLRATIGATSALTDEDVAEADEDEEGILDAPLGEREAWLPLIGGPPIPQAVYDALPSDIRKVCLLLREGHERDVFLTGLLPVLSAALPNIRTKYGRRWKGLALSAAVVAPAGAGKSPLQLAGDCAEAIDARLRRESADARALWAELDDDGQKSKPQPPERSLRLAVDTSTRGLLDSLAANDGRGLLFETEIKTLADTFRQDWGSFKSILLKACEQEAIERVRKSEDKLYIRKPELPMAISGTPGGFTEWIESTEDGIFSRFLFYAFDAKPEWVDQFDDDEDEKLDKALARIGKRLDKMHEALSGRASDDDGKPTPLYFRFKRKQRKRLNAVFSRRLQAVNVTDRSELFASVKRGAFQAVRIAGVLAAYRLHANGTNLSIGKSYTPKDEDIEAAISLVCCYLDHAAALGLRFERDPRAKIKNEQWWTFFETLPQEFSTATAHEIGEGLTMSRSGVERALRTLTERHGLFTRLRQGRYQKVSFMADGLTEVNEATEATEATEVGPENEAFPSVPSVHSLPSGPSIPSARQNGHHEQAGGDGAATVPSVLVDDWDSESTDDIEGDE